MTESHFHKGREAFDEENWVEAIRSFLASIQEDAHHVDSYVALIESYEAAAEEYGDSELLEQATKVCRDARRLKLSEKQRAIVDAAIDRIQERLQELDEDAGE